jgi:hypothetical protein
MFFLSLLFEHYLILAAIFELIPRSPSPLPSPRRGEGVFSPSPRWGEGRDEGKLEAGIGIPQPVKKYLLTFFQVE